jgi:nitrogen fixation NifU-like protein
LGKMKYKIRRLIVTTERHEGKEVDMSSDLDNFVQDLQNQIDEETREAYGNIAFDRWIHPLYMGTIENPDGYAQLSGSCGDTMQIFLRFENNRVKEASFQTNGCGSSAVCGSFVAEMALGKTPNEIQDITGETVLGKLGGLPEEEKHSAVLAGETLRQALNDYIVKQTK